MRGLPGRCVIVTGGASGIGAAVVDRLESEGAHAVSWDLTLPEDGRASAAAVVDVTDEQAVADAMAAALDRWGRIHGLVNCAGIMGPAHRLGDQPADAVRKVFDVNTHAVLATMKAALGPLADAGGGAIVNVASLAGRTPLPGAATYSASKFGLRVFTFALGEELAGSGIKVAAVSPGPIDTGFIMANIDSVADITFSQPLSTADQVAQAVMDLCVNEKREQSMPAASGFLTTLSYLFPALGRWLRPALAAKGRRVKARLKAQMQAATGPGDEASRTP